MTSVFAGLRPTFEPSSPYAALAALLERASKNLPPVRSAIARSVSGSGGTGTVPLKPPKPKSFSVPFGVPRATV